MIPNYEQLLPSLSSRTSFGASLKILHFIGSDVKVCKLVELPEMEGRKCVIIGTLFCDQRLKPSILKDISEEVGLYLMNKRSIRGHFSNLTIIILFILQDKYICKFFGSVKIAL